MAKALRADKVGEHRTAFERNRKKLLKLGGVCGICGKEIDPLISDPLDPMAPVIDHIIPISKGGHPSDIANLQLAHRWCNRQKADRFSIRPPSLTLQDDVLIPNDALPLHFDYTAYHP